MNQTTDSNVAHLINLIAVPVAVIAVLMVTLDIDSPIRVWATVLLFLVGPGSGLTQFLRIPDHALQLGFVFALSISIDILLGQTLLAIGNISGQAAVCILAGITCIRPIHLKRQSAVTDLGEQA